MNIQRKTKAIGYPKQVNPNDNKQLADLVYWVEHNKIQKYNASQREFLKAGNVKEWPEHLNKYASTLPNCPKSVTSVLGQVDCILNYAITIPYENKKEEYNKFSVANLKTSNIPNVIVDNALDHIDFRSKEFQQGINKLAKLLNISLHNDPTVVLKACANLISTRLHKDALAKPDNYIITGTPFPFKDADPGYDLKDEALMEAAKVLRLLYIGDLRNLQTKVNECIVAVQKDTADPKTDTSLGEVGRNKK